MKACKLCGEKLAGPPVVNAGGGKNGLGKVHLDCFIEWDEADERAMFDAAKRNEIYLARGVFDAVG